MTSFQTAQGVKEAEEASFRAGTSAEHLMNLAGRGIALEIIAHFPYPGVAIAYLGKGNNGGDALVALHHLRIAGWSIGIRSPYKKEEISHLSQKKWTTLEPVSHLTEITPDHRPLIFLDGLLGIGSSGPIREPLASFAREMNQIRTQKLAHTIAIDMPSGLNCDTAEWNDDTIIADLTCTVAIPKSGLSKDLSISHVGSIAFIPLPELTPKNILDQDHLITPHTLSASNFTRPYDFHKGQAGRVGIVAGSRGFIGAAALTSLGALRGGAGLITLFVLEKDYQLILPLIPIEVMVKPIKDYQDILNENLDALAIGPGLGTPDPEIQKQLYQLIMRSSIPTILDADALNLIACKELLSGLTSHHLLTPHPGEMKRLLPEINLTENRASIARAFTDLTPAKLLFKGARTIVTSINHPLAYNTTGTPGMATGGQGDLLTGLIAALVAQKHTLIQAACAGAWLAGRASELALSHGYHSVHSLSATTTAEFIGQAFRELKH